MASVTTVQFNKQRTSFIQMKGCFYEYNYHENSVLNQLWKSEINLTDASF
jgi:hypothetical protein